MLRFLVLLLVLANGLYYAWSQAWLGPVGLAPMRQSEPQHLAQQIEPQRLHLLTPDELRARQQQSAPPAPAPQPAAAPVVEPVATGPTRCLRAGLFLEPEASAVRKALQASNLPSGSWAIEEVSVNGQWIVYTGKLASVAARNRMREELVAMKLRVEPLPNGALEPGLSLGTYLSEASAQAAQQALTRRGVRDTRVVLHRPEKKGLWLRLPAADDALRARVQTLDPALASQPLHACR